MKYSIVVPVYNVENYLHACISSVLAQTYQDYELILVDDGSADRSGMICDSFAREYPEKVIVLHYANYGALVARQQGIVHSSGDVIMFLDADDCLREDALMQVNAVFLREACDMVVFNASLKPDYSESYFPHNFTDNECFEDKTKSKLYNVMVLSSSMNSLCIKAVKKSITKCLPDYMQWPRVTNGEDLLCSLPLITNAKKIVYLAENLYYYRQREGSAVHSFNPRRKDSIKQVHMEFERYIDIWQLPKLHQQHYSREVKGWIDTLLILMENKKNIDSSELNKNLKTMAEDEYFRCAYENMDTEILDRKYHLLAKWLYRKRFFLLRIAVFFRSIKLKVKNYK